MKAVHILLRGDAIDDGVVVEMGGGRGLWTRMPWTVGSVLSVQFLKYHRRGRGSLVAVNLGDDAHGVAGSLLVAHVDLRGGIVSNEHHRKPRSGPPLAQARVHPSLNRSLNDLRNGSTIQNLPRGVSARCSVQLLLP